MRFTLLSISILAFLISSCSTESVKNKEFVNDTGDINSKQNEQIDLIGDSRDEGLMTSAKYKNVSYSIRTISAFDFLERQGKSADKGDVEHLKNEAVIIMEYDSNTQKSLLDLEQIQMTKDDIMRYFSGQFINAIRCKQSDETLVPSGAQLDGSMRIDNKIKVLIFGLKIDLNKPFTLEYYDSIFGAGLMKFKFNKDKSLV